MIVIHGLSGSEKYIRHAETQMCCYREITSPIRTTTARLGFKHTPETRGEDKTGRNAETQHCNVCQGV